MVGPEFDNHVGVYIKLLRNICRAVHIPVILSGTNSRVQNLVGKNDILESRSGESKPWVKVVTLLPKATLESFGHLVKFKPWDNLDLEYSLVDFMNPTKTDLSYASLFQSLIDAEKFNDEDLKKLMSLFRFVVKQSHTNLPGIAIISCKLLVDLIIGLRQSDQIDCKAIWIKLIDQVQAAVIKRKPKIADLNGKLASLHILTFPSKIKSKHESGDNAGKKVDNHLFRFGKANETGIFVLSAGDSTDREDVVFERDNDEWKDHCYFPKLLLDFFAHMISWNSWWFKIDKYPYTVAGVYQTYLNDAGSYKVYSGPVITDFFRLELLAHWTICYASHLNMNGFTSGLELIKEFVRNLQVCKVDSALVEFNETNLLPSNLINFLKRVTVPYLVTPEAINAALCNELAGFTRFGKSWRPKNKVGWDVIFNAFLDDKPNNCFIECKLWKASIGLSLIHRYYKRACDLGSAVSFLVCRSFNQSLEKVFEDVTDLELEAEGNLPDQNELPVVSLEVESIEIEDTNPDPPETKPFDPPQATDEPVVISKKPKLAPITIDSFNQLWSQPKNQINLYTVKSIIQDSRITLEYKAIKEFPNPTGVFIITQSLFSPPTISGQSR